MQNAGWQTGAKRPRAHGNVGMRCSLFFSINSSLSPQGGHTPARTLLRAELWPVEGQHQHQHTPELTEAATKRGLID